MIILLFSRFTTFFFVSMSWKNTKKWKPCTYFWLYVWFCPGRCWKHLEQVVPRKKKNQLKNPHPNLQRWKKSPVKSWPKYLTTMMRYWKIAHFHEKIVIFYTEILTGKVVLWCFFMSETSEKIQNSTFLVMISV